jgi:DNA-binding PadR family transcriptional regulator
MNTSKAEMREPTYFVLASLLDGPLHGYAIIQRAAELSDGRVRLATGTLYTALDRLTAEGYVRLVSEEIVNGRARRSYGLTESGSAALRAEATRMAAAAELVTRREVRSRRGAAIRKERLARAPWSGVAARCCAPIPAGTGGCGARKCLPPCWSPASPGAAGLRLAIRERWSWAGCGFALRRTRG